MVEGFLALLILLFKRALAEAALGLAAWVKSLLAGFNSPLGAGPVTSTSNPLLSTSLNSSLPIPLTKSGAPFSWSGASLISRFILVHLLG